MEIPVSPVGPQVRPQGMGELLDQSLRIYRRNFLKFMGMVALILIPQYTLTLILGLLTVNFAGAGSSRTLSGGYSAAAAVSSIGQSLVSLVGAILLQLAAAAVVRAVSSDYFGKSMGVIEAYRSVGRSWGPLLGTLILTGFVALGMTLWTIIPCVGWFTGPGMLTIFSYVVIPLITPVVVLEGIWAFDGIHRAWDLVRRRFWWILGFMFLLALFSVVLIVVPAGLIGVLLGLLQTTVGGNVLDGSTVQILTVITEAVVGMIGGLLFQPLQLTAVTLLYFDLRVRFEGFDLAVLSHHVLGTTETGDDVVNAIPTARLSSEWFTQDEWGGFVAVTFGYGVLYGIIVVISMALTGFVGLIAS